MAAFDYLVIGAGISGASAACELSVMGSTLLLETENAPGYHSTGRSAALYTPNFGSDVVRRINAASHGFFTRPPQGFADGPLLTPRGALTLARPGEEDRLETVLALSTTAHQIHAISTAAAQKLAPLVRPQMLGAAAYEPGVMDMDVAAIHQGFLKLLRHRGGEMRCNAPLTSLKRNRGIWHAVAGGLTVEARVIVNAAGAWGDMVARLAGAAPVGLIAKRRTAILVAPPAGPDLAGMPLVEFAGDAPYFKPDAGRIMASPGDETPVLPQDIQPEEWDIAVLVDWLGRHTTLEVRRIAHSWAGLRSFVADHRPVAGFDPAIENFFWLVGQGGYGIMMAPSLARAAAALIGGGSLPADLSGLGLTPADLAPDRAGLDTAEAHLPHAS